MVRHLLFLLSLASQTLSLMDYLSARRLCCASVYLKILVTLAWRVLGVPWPPLFQIHPSWIFCQRLCSVFYGRSQACLLGVSLVLFGVLPENITGSPLHALSYLFFFGGSSSPGELHVFKNHLLRALLFLTRCFPHPLCRLTLEGLPSLLKALAELGRINLPSIGIYFGL